MTASGHVAGWVRPALIFVVLTLSVQLLPGLSDLWRFSRPAFESGAWWQPVTSQWVHLSMLHAVVNASAMVLLLLAFDQLVGWRTQVIALLGGYLGAGILIAIDPACISYAGASGALHGLLVGNSLSVLVGPASRTATTSAKTDALIRPHDATRALALIPLLIVAIKLWIQHATTANASAGWLGFVTYYPSHEAGSLGGLFASAMASALLRGNSFAKRQASHSKCS